MWLELVRQPTDGLVCDTLEDVLSIHEKPGDAIWILYISRDDTFLKNSGTQLVTDCCNLGGLHRWRLHWKCRELLDQPGRVPPSSELEGQPLPIRREVVVQIEVQSQYGLHEMTERHLHGDYVTSLHQTPHKVVLTIVGNVVETVSQTE